MAVEKETQLEAWLEENMPNPVTNPNYVETIVGTLRFPFDLYSISEIRTMLESDDYTLKISFPIYGNVEINLSIDPIEDNIVISWFDDVRDEELLMYRAYFSVNTINIFQYQIKASDYYGSIDDISNDQSMLNIQTSLKIIHHPLT